MAGDTCDTCALMKVCISAVQRENWVGYIAAYVGYRRKKVGKCDYTCVG